MTKRTLCTLFIWIGLLVSMSAQAYLEQKAKQHFTDNNWKEATILYELIHKTQHSFKDSLDYGRALAAAFNWKEGNRFESFFIIATNDSIEPEKIIYLVDKALIEVDKENQISDLLFHLIEIEKVFNDSFWQAAITFLTNQRAYDKAFIAKEMQLKLKATTDTDRLQLAALALENNKTNTALKLYQEVLANDSINITAHIAMGSILYIKGINIYKKTPIPLSFFINNIDEEYDRYVTLTNLNRDYFKKAITSLEFAKEINANSYITEQIETIKRIQNETNALYRKLQRIEKYRNKIPNNNTKETA